ncbi:MAG: heavy-metal-associated domain-containing protein [Thermoanaerobaculia bacterium]
MKRVLFTVLLALLALGLFAETAKHANVVIAIKGMHCDGCAKGITAMLERTEGVIAAKVSFEKREADVTYDSEAVSPAKIVDAIEKLGYEAEVKK